MKVNAEKMMGALGALLLVPGLIGLGGLTGRLSLGRYGSEEIKTEVPRFAYHVNVVSERAGMAGVAVGILAGAGLSGVFKAISDSKSKAADPRIAKLVEAAKTSNLDDLVAIAAQFEAH